VDWKADRSPVTAADRESEAAILATIREAFPEHAILAEESGESAGRVPARWVVDPLDGTRGFSRGGAFWGPLVALEDERGVAAGAMALPALGVVYWAGRGLGCHRNGERIRLAEPPARWSDATFSFGEPRAVFSGPWGEAMAALVREAASSRCYGDVAGAAQLLDGRADAWAECGVQRWDLAALEVLVTEAGGLFTDLDGGPALPVGRALAATPVVHGWLLEMLRRRPDPSSSPRP
jgi:histidinol-phosphatase